MTIKEIKEELETIWRSVTEMREEGCSYEDQAATYEYAFDRLSSLVNICIKKLEENNLLKFICRSINKLF